MKKEKVEKDMYVKVQPSLYDKFKTTCDENYNTVSAVIRELMMRYIKENEKK